MELNLIVTGLLGATLAEVSDKPFLVGAGWGAVMGAFAALALMLVHHHQERR